MNKLYKSSLKGDTKPWKSDAKKIIKEKKKEQIKRQKQERAVDPFEH